MKLYHIIIVVVALFIAGCGTEPEWPSDTPQCTLYWVSYLSGPPNIWAMDFPDGFPRQVTFFPEGCGRWGFDFSPDGAIVFGGKENSQWNVFRIDEEGAEPVRLTDNPQFDGEPAISPDGGILCFMTKRWFFSTYDAELALIGANGGDVTRLTTWEGADDSPVWSPDGSRIAFVRENLYGRYTIMLVDPDSPDSAVELTSLSDDAYDPCWMPDGSMIVCVMTVNGIRDIWKIPLDGGSAVNLTKSDWSDESPTISSDGSMIAHQIYHDGRWDIAITPIDGSVTRFLTDDEYEDISPSWSPDGNWVFWIRRLSGNREVYCAPANGLDEPFRVTNSPGDDIRVRCR